ncbi:MarR family winged helix-turn-helix transcriptional regulator [Actinacidiphila paucisporea]|uniref:DNA-binding transcriptional regulator, MarR family n=1 Tax=Actinacidiphila paucisporea TaxID=310782 RepID=A0A1M7CGB7_9ACTN|nr:MarR family winged helix-turn-helix transcriptional regulator [Actinacidiphila paucisporea]SHL66206.1 DNA-binding transcriptional regulator, MarR family [Actinacidiphila paucisporea]
MTPDSATATATAPSPSPVTGSPDVSYLLQHTAHVLATQMTAALAEIGMSPRAHCVLAHAAQTERTQAQLAELSDLDKTTMVVTVDQLERAGLAERVPSATDRRARIIRVTAAGADVVAAGQQIVDRVHGDVLGALPEPERSVFVSALNRLTTGHLATPADSPDGVQAVRRPRQSRQ